MRRLRRMIGIVLLAAVASLGVPTVFAGPQESPGITGPQESPGITTDVVIYLASTFIP
ncbi:MAG TPA: hypothetical protein VKB86_20090 [Pyrinomonadaceae bacterium]|nr:hypothetical protein [Pyrinomonadaceae bacterium]